MRKILAIITALLTFSVTAGAMSYEQAREQALFLTDKMAYELNLTEEQYDAAYEINLDYLMSINTPDDLYEAYWRQRNLDLSYILLDWQYRAFCAATYFYRPIYWTAGVWHFAVYSHYPRRDYLYFGRTNIYITYRGGHGWRHNGGHSWYKGKTFHHGKGGQWHGLRDRFDREDFSRGDRHNNRIDRDRHNGNRKNQADRFAGNRNNRRHNPPTTLIQNKYQRNRNNDVSRKTNREVSRSHRESSTRTTARPNTARKAQPSFNGKRQNSGGNIRRTPSNTFRPNRSTAKQGTRPGKAMRRHSGNRNNKNEK